MLDMRSTANTMIKNIIAENMPEASVKKALSEHDFANKNIYLVAIGKAAYTMAAAAHATLGNKIKKGVVITKYDHPGDPLPGIDIFEAGHPTPDENTVTASQKALELIQNLSPNDEVLFLVSGGGSALFEAPKEGITLDILVNITNDLLASGADIVEINMLRKRLSKVKAGGFAKLCAPASVFAIVLSDVLGDRLDTIASGPAAADMSTVEDALGIIEKYKLSLPQVALDYIKEETPKEVTNVKTVITGSVKSLCTSAAMSAQALGYKPYVLTTTLSCEASEAGKFLAQIAVDTKRGETSFKTPCAIIVGGETVVHLKGKGKGGRNQEIALAAAKAIAGVDGTLVFSVGSDGTDGPTDAAGGIVDEHSLSKLKAIGHKVDTVLANNDSYNSLKEIDGLIITGPTGTNVNDVAVVLCK